VRIYRCYSPSRKETTEDWNGFAYGEDSQPFAEMVDEHNHQTEDEPHDWVLQMADVEWQEATR